MRVSAPRWLDLTKEFQQHLKTFIIIKMISDERPYPVIFLTVSIIDKQHLSLNIYIRRYLQGSVLDSAKAQTGYS